MSDAQRAVNRLLIFVDEVWRAVLLKQFRKSQT